MTAVSALTYSLFFGLLHGILPDEHTWPIAFSYAIGGASGKQGIKAGLYFSAAFTLQRTLFSELSYLAIVPFLFTSTVQASTFLLVGMVMAGAGIFVFRANRYPHVHFLGHHHENLREMDTTSHLLGRTHLTPPTAVAAPPIHWTMVHGFIAGFGFGPFSLFVNTVACQAMPNAWFGFLPGLFFGLGTMATLALVAGLFGQWLRWSNALSESEIKRIGAQTGARALFFGGLLFVAFGITTLFGGERYLPFDPKRFLVILFFVAVAVPALLYSVRETLLLRSRLPTTDRGQAY